VSFFCLVGNVLPLAAGGDLEALNCQPALKLNRSTNLKLTTSPPLAANGSLSKNVFCISFSEGLKLFKGTVLILHCERKMY